MQGGQAQAREIRAERARGAVRERSALGEQRYQQVGRGRIGVPHVARHVRGAGRRVAERVRQLLAEPGRRGQHRRGPQPALHQQVGGRARAASDDGEQMRRAHRLAAGAGEVLGEPTEGFDLALLTRLRHPMGLLGAPRMLMVASSRPNLRAATRSVK